MREFVVTTVRDLIRTGSKTSLPRSLEEADLPIIRKFPDSLLPAPIPAGQHSVPTPADLRDLFKGKGSLIRLPVGATEDPRITKAFTALAKGQLHNADAWERLFLSLGAGRAALYVATKHGWFRVRGVVPDYGGESGVLKVTGVGKVGRGRGVIEIDIEDAVGHAIPTIWYR